MLVEHQLGRRGALVGQQITIVGAPIKRIGARAIVAGEMRHHVALVKLVGTLGLREVGPVMDLLQEHAEIALLGIQPLDQRDGIVRGADNAEFVLDEPFGRVVAFRHVEAELVVVQVVQIAFEPELHVLHRLGAGFRDMHRADKAQPRRVHRPPLFGREVVGDLPVGGQRVEPERVGGGHADHRQIVFTGQPPTRRRDRAHHRHFRIGLGIGQHMRPGVDEVVPIGLLGDVFAFEQAQNQVQRFGHAIALRIGIDAHHQRIGSQQARTGAEHHAAARMVIELDDPVRHHQRIMVWQRDHARPELDRLGPFGGHRDEKLR